MTQELFRLYYSMTNNVKQEKKLANINRHGFSQCSKLCLVWRLVGVYHNGVKSGWGESDWSEG